MTSTEVALEPELVLTGEAPIQQQIVDQLREMILTNRLRPGEQLPTVRAVAVQLAVNPHLVVEAYAMLAREGCLTTEEDSGHFVADAERLHRLAAERRSRLEQLCEQFLACASAQGFPSEEALRTAQALSQRSTPCPHT